VSLGVTPGAKSLYNIQGDYIEPSAYILHYDLHYRSDLESTGSFNSL